VNNRKNRAEYRRKRTHLKQIAKKKEDLDDPSCIHKAVWWWATRHRRWDLP
jgi:DNA-directed RNA polymerase subunit M/transcription elongation factor TFIIS